MKVNSYVEYTNPKDNDRNKLYHFSLYQIVEISDKGVRVYSRLWNRVIDGVFPIEDFTEVINVRIGEVSAIWSCDYTGEMLELKKKRDEQRQRFFDQIRAING